MSSEVLRTIIIGDLHYGAKNIEDHKILAARIHETIDACEREGGKLDMIVSLGDELNDHNPPADVRGACVQFLRSLAARCNLLVVLVGNHTRKNNRVSIGPEHTLADLSLQTDENRNSDSDDYGVCTVETPRMLRHKGFRFLALPYIDPPQFDEIIDRFCPEMQLNNGAAIDFVFGHQEIHGVPLQVNLISECSAHWRNEWPPFISGHIHERYIIRNAFYPGTPMQHRSDESKDKYIYAGEFRNPVSRHRKYDDAHPSEFGHVVDAADPTKFHWTKHYPRRSYIGFPPKRPRLSGESCPTPGTNEFFDAGMKISPGGIYSSLNVDLQEIFLADLPIRHVHTIKLGEVGAFSNWVESCPRDYFTVTVVYENEQELVTSRELANLQSFAGRVKVKTEMLRAAVRPTIFAGNSGQVARSQLSFGDYLQNQCAGTPEGAILSSIGQWNVF